MRAERLNCTALVFAAGGTAQPGRGRGAADMARPVWDCRFGENHCIFWHDFEMQDAENDARGRHSFEFRPGQGVSDFDF